MRLLTGPAGSGKTPYILDSMRQALRSRDLGVRLLVPTATLAQHLQNLLAREGFVFPCNLIETLSNFVEPWAGDLPQSPDPVTQLLVEEAAHRVHRPEFARVADTTGFYASLTKTIEDFASAGCDSAQLGRHLPDAPLAEAFLAVYCELDRILEERGLRLRARRLERAAERIALEGTGAVRTIWMDGFHALPDPELRVIEALSRHAELTLTLDERDLTGALRSRLEAMGSRRESLPRVRPAPAVALVRAPNMDREADEIARRIVEQSAAGRPFREIAIVVRPSEAYVPLLRSTLERFGIPARFYFEEKLDEHATVRFLTAAMDAMLGGWDWSATLAALRLAPRFADSNALDRFDFTVREQIPNAGLGGLKAFAEGPGSEALAHKLEALGQIEEWRQFELAPQHWAARLRLLRNLFRPARPDPANRAGWQLWRSQAAALNLFDEALDETALALGHSLAMPLEAFWRPLRAILRLKPLRLSDGRRNVVHVLSAHEARQWVLPVVFVCGLVEKLFPKFHPQDVFFPDGARAQLNAAGIRVRTAAEMEREERALFESAVTRATMLATLSFPESDARGERNLRSAFLEGWMVEEHPSVAVRPRPRGAAGKSAAGIRSPHLLEFVARKTARVSPTSLETYLQCPFQYFGRSLLRLKRSPLRPEERLDFLTQGEIVHEVLARWYADRGDIAALFEEVFARKIDEKQIPGRYHTERLRNAMLDDLIVFTLAPRFPAGQFRSRMEEKFEFALDDSLWISGKIDRLDESPAGGAYVVDYKYSNAQNTRGRRDNPNLLQAPLYLLAVEKFFGLNAAGMYYIGLKGGVAPAGWEAADLDSDWLEQARSRTLAIVEQIRAGRTEVAPADRDKCRFCDCADVCRIEIAPAAAEGA
ncbi:MAG TPA: PD-(D/E)XK nuclease family protein [Bryobacteraceae bacterium]|nr:PD-(D/E)XK nuclease family protein [Bryobacteraceae bacterium]